MSRDASRAARMRRGTAVFAVLVVLTALEYVLALPDRRLLLLPLIALAAAKAWAILDKFMHIRDLFGPEGD